MLNKHDLTERFHVTLKDIAEWHAVRVLPEAIRVDGECYWREEDVNLFERYLRDRLECREKGIDPDAINGPPVPIYSQGIPSVDPREIMQQVREDERRKRSRTLARENSPPAAKPVKMPEATPNAVGN